MYLLYLFEKANQTYLINNVAYIFSNTTSAWVSKNCIDNVVYPMLASLDPHNGGMRLNLLILEEYNRNHLSLL